MPALEALDRLLKGGVVRLRAFLSGDPAGVIAWVEIR